MKKRILSLVLLCAILISSTVSVSAAGAVGRRPGAQGQAFLSPTISAM